MLTFQKFPELGVQIARANLSMPESSGLRDFIHLFLIGRDRDVFPLYVVSPFGLRRIIIIY